MKLNNKATREMTAEIALTDSELEAVYGGSCPFQPPCGGGDPSYSDGGYPSYNGGGYPSYGQSYGSPSYGQSYGSPFDSSSCSGSGSTPSYMTITYTTVVPSNSSPCNGGY